MASLRDPERLDKVAKFELSKRLDTYEVEVVRNYAEALESIRSDIGKIYERYSVDGKLTLAEMTKFNRLRNLEKQLTEDITPVGLKNTALIERMTRVEYDEAFYRFAWTIDQQAGVSLQWGLLRAEDIKSAVANPLRKIAEERLRDEGRRKIRRAVTQGLIRGDSYPAMMRGIKDAINGTAADAMRIVRTEGQRAQVMGQQATYKKARKLGVEAVEAWDAALDGKTRPEHGALDGVQAKYKSGQPYWQTSVGRVRGPTQSGVASFDINCRCRVTSRVKGYEPKVRRIRDKGLVPYKPYSKWVMEDAPDAVRKRYVKEIGGQR